jgi:hypothetical protein
MSRTASATRQHRADNHVNVPFVIGGCERRNRDPNHEERLTGSHPVVDPAEHMRGLSVSFLTEYDLAERQAQLIDKGKVKHESPRLEKLKTEN